MVDSGLGEGNNIVASFVFKIMIVSDHRILRQGLRMLLERPADFHVVDDVDCRSALARTAELRPTIVLLDLKLPQVDLGLSLLAEIRQLQQDTRVITLTPSGANSSLLLRAIRAGAAGYVPDVTSDISMIEEAIRKVAHGHLYLSNTALVTLLSTISNHDLSDSPNGQSDAGVLSPREYEVLALVAKGYTNRQISAQLVISESTARSHVHNILDKLHLKNRVQVAAFALKRPAILPKNRVGTAANLSSTVLAGS
jgi:DNA-binding NarL/FixJ family response regulator